MTLHLDCPTDVYTAQMLHFKKPADAHTNKETKQNKLQQ